MAIYHLTVKTGSRHSGQSAGASSDYITRQGRYASDAGELVYTGSGNMPGWAKVEPGKYWEAADEYERANGRLYISVEFALPKELNKMQQIELTTHYLKAVCGNQPYQFAIHKGDGANPHCHVLISERVNDGINRGADKWFLRASPKSPELGGAIKNRQLKSADWLLSIRERWANSVNNYMAIIARKPDIRIDHRSHADRRLGIEPTAHRGPALAAILRKLDSQIAAAQAAEVMRVVSAWHTPTQPATLSNALSKAQKSPADASGLAQYTHGIPEQPQTQPARPQRRYSSRDDGPSR